MSNGKANTNRAPLLPNWFWQTALGSPRGINVIELRQFAKSNWYQMVKRTIKNQIMLTDWDIVLTNEDENTDEKVYQEDIEKIKQLLNFPNRNGMTFGELWGTYLDDLLDLDAGVIWKGRNVSGELTELYSYDGGRFLWKIDQHGILDHYLQFSFLFPTSAPLPFDKDELIYGKMGVNNDMYPYGWSPLQSIQQIIEIMIQSARQNKEFFENNSIPDGLAQVDMDQDALDRFRAYWQQQTKGQGSKLVFTNVPVNFVPMTMSRKDMQWLEGEKWYFHLIFGAYGLSPAEVGFYDDVNRASQEGQERTTVKNAIRPYLVHIADKINREIIPELIDHKELEFRWFPKDDQAEKLEHEQTMAKLNANVITINEVRTMEGKEPVEWGDQPMAMAMQERAAEMMPDNGNKDNSKDNPKDKKKEEEKEDAKKLYQKLFTSFVKRG